MTTAQAWHSGLYVHSSGYQSHGAGRVLDVRDGLVVYETLDNGGRIEVLPIVAQTTFFRSEVALRDFVLADNDRTAAVTAHHRARAERRRESHAPMSIETHLQLMTLMGSQSTLSECFPTLWTRPRCTGRQEMTDDE